jgi:phosphatidylglycerol---prolipoprotein diacylglyceryl transferase
MHKILLSHPQIGSYSVCLLAGLFGGYLLTRWLAIRGGIKGSHIDNLALLICVLSLFGARLFSWLFYFPPGSNLWQALWDPAGGMVFYGGMIFGALTLVVYARLAKLELSSLLDSFAPGLALGLALGRVGCFMAGCCWGDVCVDRAQVTKADAGWQWQIRTVPLLSQVGFPLAVRFPEGSGAYEQHRHLGLIDEQSQRSLPVHPVQLYEAALALALCGFLTRRFGSRLWRGQIVCLFLFGYAGIRFATEFLRADNQPIYFGLTLSQVISLMLAGVGLIAWLSREKQEQLTPERSPGAQPLAAGAARARTASQSAGEIEAGQFTGLKRHG